MARIFLNLIVFFCIGNLNIFSQEHLNLLLYTKTAGFRHKSITTGKDAFKLWAKQENWIIHNSESPTDVNTKHLSNIDVVVFLNTTLDVLDESSRKAFQRFINEGGGFVGIHAASDTEFNWPWYYQMIGAYFKNHPKVQVATLKIHQDTKHPSISHLKDSLTIKDEWYNFRDDVLKRVNVLMTIDENSYKGHNKDKSHPISWYHYFDGGRIFYTGMGHTLEIYKNPDFINHVKSAVNWAGKRIDVPLSNTWESLLDKDLTKWDIFIGSPHKSVDIDGYQKSDDGKSGKPIGMNKDPKNVFSMTNLDGEEVLKISGEIYGGLSSKEEYGNYHLKAQFKWGNQKYAPRLKRKMDSGILYHCQGEQGVFWNVWMQSLEFQLQESDCGDFYALGNVYGDVPSNKIVKNGKKTVVFDPKGTTHYAKSRKQALSRVRRSKLYEKPNGEWNSFELICLEGTSLHIVNGHVVNVVKNARYDINGKTIPITSGKIQLQSEGAEAYFKNIQIKAINKLPRKYKRQAKL